MPVPVLVLMWTIGMYLAISVGVGNAIGQSRTAARRSSEITVFGQATYLQPDWGADNNNWGATAGMALTPFIPLWVEPSFELRVSTAGGSEVTERTFSGGLKLATKVGRLHPYFVAEKGVGGIYFKHPTINYNGKPYLEDSSPIYVLGGGVEIQTVPHWQIRLDFSQQYWNLNPPRIGPMALSFGVTYRIPFGKDRTK
jgi:hypothetical protein